MPTPTVDINAAIQALRGGNDLAGKDGIFVRFQQHGLLSLISYYLCLRYGV
ncbi:hypothetical protein P4S54_22005 [Shewanella sp. PP-He15 brown]|uniref:hypothetical protein n=1 Tax=Shewanella baltica TaxID=62322 RepID=UPI00302EB09F